MRWALIAVLGAACLAALVWAVVRPQRASMADQRQAAVAFRTGAVQRLIDEAGAVVVDEIKPSLPDLVYGKLAPEQFQNYSVGWRASLDRARRRFDTCQAPSRLRPAATLYDTALRQYVDAVDAFAAASRRPAPEISSGVSAGAHVAEKADATWDRAGRLVSAELKRVGAPDPPPKRVGGAVSC